MMVMTSSSRRILWNSGPSVRALTLLLEHDACFTRLLAWLWGLGLAGRAAGRPPVSPACWAGQDQLAAEAGGTQLVLVPRSVTVPALWTQGRNMEGQKIYLTKLSEKPALWKRQKLDIDKVIHIDIKLSI